MQNEIHVNRAFTRSNQQSVQNDKSDEQNKQSRRFNTEFRSKSSYILKCTDNKTRDADYWFGCICFLLEAPSLKEKVKGITMITLLNGNI